MMEAGLALVKKALNPGKTFKVSARRGDKTFHLDTNELNYQIGSYILKNMEDLNVDVRNPDIKLNVEVRKEGVYLSSEIYQGCNRHAGGGEWKSYAHALRGDR